MKPVTAPQTTQIEVTLLGAALGARIDGVDLSTALDDATLAAVRAAFLDHLVLVFPGQHLSPERQVAFTGRFGAVEPHPMRSRPGVEGFPEVMILENRPGRPGARTDDWHSDITCAERPPALSVLHAIEVPEGRGDTMFCNMYAAYQDLSETLRRTLDGMAALHSGQSLADRNNQPGTDALPIADVPPPVSHPVVRCHPESGRRALFVNPGFTIAFAGMTCDESEGLLRYLYARATRPENVYRHRWSPGDVVMWDNRCAMHSAVHDYDETMPRLMHRTTAAGDSPV